MSQLLFKSSVMLNPQWWQEPPVLSWFADLAAEGLPSLYLVHMQPCNACTQSLSPTTEQLESNIIVEYVKAILIDVLPRIYNNSGTINSDNKLLTGNNLSVKVQNTSPQSRDHMSG